jgi:hypothetical protein
MKRSRPKNSYDSRGTDISYALLHIRRGALQLVVLALGTAAAYGVAAGQDTKRSWVEEKCARYDAAWTEALDRMGSEGLGEEFLETHASFLQSGCDAQIRVCPRTAEELRMADVMIISAMNAGMASTFPPFACGG